jgi:hypothetical protein
MAATDIKNIPLTPDPKNLPAPEAEQTVTIRPGSGLAVIGMFVEIIRKRFLVEANLPWVWYSDIKEGAEKAIAIESAYNEDTDHRNFRAAVYVDRDEQTIGRTVIGDLAGQHIPSSLRGFWALETVPILIECVAAKKAESAILSDLVAIYLHASSDLIQSKFGLHEMTPITRGRTQPFPRDKTQFVTPISFSTQFNLRWTNKPTAPLIQQIAAEVSVSGFEDATSYFETIAIYGRQPAQ